MWQWPRPRGYGERLYRAFRFPTGPELSLDRRIRLSHSEPVGSGLIEPTSDRLTLAGELRYWPADTLRVSPMNRRDYMLSTAGGAALLGAAWLASKLGTLSAPRHGPPLGASLISWDDRVNRDPEAWRRAIAVAQALGLQRVTIVTYGFVDGYSGKVSAASRHGLVPGPGPEVLAAAITAAHRLGLGVSLRPWVEIDNRLGEGKLWRGRLKLAGPQREAFFASYSDYLSPLADIARRHGADRFYIGSEMAGLTADNEATELWQRLIERCRTSLGSANCRLSYAANFSEYTHVRFWDALDEIGVDAYFPLATREESSGPGNPPIELLSRGWDRALERVCSFAKAHSRPLYLTEWGAVPFDGTSAEPSASEPSSIADPDEAVHVYRATLAAFARKADRLAGSDFWHLAVDPNEDSNYRVTPGSPLATLLREHLAT